MGPLVLIALALGAGQTLPAQLARALPCSARYTPMAIRIAASDPQPRIVDRVMPPPRRELQRRPPCFRLAGARA